MVRFKNRYLVVQVNEIPKYTSSWKFNEYKLSNVIENKIQQIYGDFGVAAIQRGFTSRYCNNHTRVTLLRVRRGPHRLVASVLPLITSLQDKKVTITTLYTGATIRQCFFFIKNYQQQKFDEFCSVLRTEEDKAALIESMKKFECALDMAIK